MKIEKLNENKIKFTITIDDLTARNIDLYSFVYNSPESQDLFWDMMNEAEREYGFNVDDSMIYVETATAGSESFTLTVMRIYLALPFSLPFSLCGGAKKDVKFCA